MVSIILPIRNEADFIERTLRSILQNHYPPERMEIIVVDGRSNDGTRGVVPCLAEEDNRIKLLDNPRRVPVYRACESGRDSRCNSLVQEQSKEHSRIKFALVGDGPVKQELLATSC